MSNPTIIAKIDEWTLTRAYDGAPLVAAFETSNDQISAEFTATGALRISWSSNVRAAVPDIPAAVLERLLADRDARIARSEPAGLEVRGG